MGPGDGAGEGAEGAGKVLEEGIFRWKRIRC